MTRRPHTAFVLAAALVAAGCASPSMDEACCSLEATLSAPPWSRSFFRPVLAVSGDGSTIAVGAERIDRLTVNVFVFRRARDGWALGESVVGLPAIAHRLFDSGTLALSDDGRSMAVGVIGQDPLVLDLVGGEWQITSPVRDDEPPRLRAMDGAAATVVVQPSDVPAGEALEVGERAAGWRDRQTLSSPLGTPRVPFPGFGRATELSRDGGVLVVGASGADIRPGFELIPEAGAAIAYPRSSAGRFEVPFALDAPDPRSGDRFGAAVSANDDGTWIAVGAPDESSSRASSRERDASAPGAGAVTMFRFAGDGWVVDEHLKAARPRPWEAFGSALALSADGALLAVGVPGDSGPTADAEDAPSVGAVELFRRQAGGRLREPPLRAEEPRAQGSFGRTLAMDAAGRVLAVFALATPDGALPSGEQLASSFLVHVYDVRPP